MKRLQKLITITIAAAALSALSALPARAQAIVSQIGGVCLNVEGGVKLGARIIAWSCAGGANEKFVADGSWIKLAGTNYCLGAESRNKGAQIRLQQCNNNFSTQNFAFSGMLIKHNSGYCMNLSGAGWFGIQDAVGKPAILWDCQSNAYNEQFYRGNSPAQTVNTNSLPRGAHIAVAGRIGTYVWNGDMKTLVAQGGGNLVAQGGGNLVAQGGGN